VDVAPIQSATSLPAPQVVEVPPIQSATNPPAPQVVEVTPSTPSAVVPPPLPPRVVDQDSWKPSPTIAQSPAVPPIKGDPAHTPAMPPAVIAETLGEPYVTTGFVMIAEPDRVPAPMQPNRAPAPVQPAKTSSRPSRPSDAAVKASIEKACGSAVRDIHVKSEADGTFEIRFHTTTKSEGLVYFNRIAAIPELAPYRVECKASTDEK
jgi:hypothetical protein